MTAQSVAAKRIQFNEAWKLFEFWKDGLAEPMIVMREVLDPIVENVLKKGGKGPTDDNVEGETLLSHLAKLTDGKCRIH